MISVQNEAPTLAGHLSKVDIENGCNLSKPDIGNAIAGSPTHIGEGFSIITTRGWEDFIGVITRCGLSFATSTRDEFSDSIKKGSATNITPQSETASSKKEASILIGLVLNSCRQTRVCAREHGGVVRFSVANTLNISGGKAKKKGSTENATLWGCGFYHHEENQRSPELDDGINQPSGVSLAFFRWRRLISPCMAITINCPVLSPGSFTCSIASTTSCGARACTFCDLSFFVPVAITVSPIIWWSTVYTKIYSLKYLIWNPPCDYSGLHLEALNAQETAKPGSVEALTGPLTTTIGNVSRQLC